MATELETKTGRCATHGAVEGTREIPKITFPWIVNAVRRSMAQRHPFRCPTCGGALDQS